jgi:hypothetical protein
MTIDAKSLRGFERIPLAQLKFYEAVLDAATRTGEKFALGGAFAWAAYSGYLRNTKDIDLYVPESKKDLFIAAVKSIGATDYYDTLAYDRGWIFRSTKDEYIADLIWAMANYVRPVDDDYFRGSTSMTLLGADHAVIPAEELMLNKLFIMQRTRCDWFDVFNVLYGMEDKLDFERFINKMGENKALLASALGVFCWLCPARVGLFPKTIWESLGIEKPKIDGPDIDLTRVRYLDSRPWFIPTLGPNEHPFSEAAH